MSHTHKIDMELQDLSAVVSVSKEALLGNAKGHFNYFLTALKIPFTLEDLPEERFDGELIGKFASFLLSKDLMYNTSKMYLSSVYNYSCGKFPRREELVRRKYASTRCTLLKQCENKAEKKGEAIENSAVLGCRQDFVYMTHALFANNTKEGLYHRLLT